MLTVEITSMPASRSSSTSCQRFSFREPGTLVCANSSTSAISGLRASTASRSISSKAAPRYVTGLRGDVLQAVEQGGGQRAPVRLGERHHDVGAALGPAMALAEHGVGLADPGRGSEVDPQVPASRPAAGAARPVGAYPVVIRQPSRPCLVRVSPSPRADRRLRISIVEHWGGAGNSAGHDGRPAAAAKNALDGRCHKNTTAPQAISQLSSGRDLGQAECRDACWPGPPAGRGCAGRTGRCR